ncbi:TetR/AcrR family transcriptional regulator [Variovorax sp. J2P1-59]|uniref:TetR/AcrR family transcriptional regulator n=1 Tax=Variovorax flavidus TaxID=3053501 RepID=UPI002577FC44|nr:TetR/AcrR family transcriptional regulator [Variovorax sp. J2P1-59]MDM0078117.1 TetR/AcrR family transcriptional regulator [Variovorax sp. J2P1-59]
MSTRSWTGRAMRIRSGCWRPLYDLQEPFNLLHMTPTIRDHIIDAAGALFYREGTKSVGVDRIIVETGVAKATMYRYFSGKDALVAACLQRRHEKVVAALREGLEKMPGRRQARALAVFDLLHDKADSPDFRGCAFMLAVAENEESAEIRAIARTHKKAILEMFASLLPATWHDREKTAAQLNLLYDGAMAQILVHRLPDPARVARECAMILLRCSQGPKRRTAKETVGESL